SSLSLSPTDRVTSSYAISTGSGGSTAPFSNGIRSKRLRFAYCRITCMPSGRFPRETRFFAALELDQERIFTRPSRRYAAQLQQGRPTRKGDLATPLLGARHS